MLKEIDEGMQTLLDFPVMASSSESKDCVEIGLLTLICFVSVGFTC